MNSAGSRLEGSNDIQREMWGYYEGPLGTPFVGSGLCSVELNRAISNRIPKDMLPGLVEPVTAMEVRAAIFSIKADKAPGPDSYNLECLFLLAKLGYNW